MSEAEILCEKDKALKELREELFRQQMEHPNDIHILHEIEVTRQMQEEGK